MRVRAAQRPLGSRCGVQLGGWGTGEGEVRRPAEAEVAPIGWVEPLDRGSEIFGWEPPADGRGRAMLSGRVTAGVTRVVAEAVWDGAGGGPGLARTHEVGRWCRRARRWAAQGNRSAWADDHRDGRGQTNEG